MKSTEHWLVHDHTQIEDLLRRCCEEAEIYDWWALERYFTEFIGQLRYHVAQEEEVLYPAYDARRAPEHMFTDDLYEDHSRIIDIIGKIHRLIEGQEKEGLVELFKQLVDVMFEHNQKEEHVFLPFASHLLCEDRDELSEKLDNFTLSRKSRVWAV